MKKNIFLSLLIFFFSIFFLIETEVFSQEKTQARSLDEKVKSFLENYKGDWQDMNVPESDGKLLYDIILKNNYKSALEIGTSTGRSGIWMAWALSKTGGKLITIEIDKNRYEEALINFKKAGLSDFIDARLADAHELVKELKGPFDFVFCDADKNWYKNYFIDTYPKLKTGGCYTAHNVSGSNTWRRHIRSGTAIYYEYIKTLKNMETTVDNSGNGLAISYKKSDK